MKRPGRIVRTKDGIIGRTYNDQDLINGKVMVYPDLGIFKYSEKAILCRPETLTLTGFVD